VDKFHGPFFYNVTFAAHLRRLQGIFHCLISGIIKTQKGAVEVWMSYNENPDGNRVGDCTVRAIATVLGQSWEQTSVELFVQSFIMRSMMSENDVWGAYLYRKGFQRGIFTEICPSCYTVRDFCRENPKGRYILAISGHVAAVIDGNLYDTWDSSDEHPVYYWAKKEE
jgi:hypothetical protein